MAYYYVAEPVRVGGSVRFSVEESRHMLRSRRHRLGDRVQAVDGRGTGYELELVRIAEDRVEGQVLRAGPGQGEPRVRVAFAPGVLKGDHLAEVVGAVTQLGVTEVLPFRSARTVGRFGPGRVERLRKVALEAMKCSHRSVWPVVRDPVDIDELVPSCRDFELALVAWEEEKELTFERALTGNPASVLVVVGPEGGLEQAEAEAFRRAGARVCSLGPRPLRAELAGTVAVSALMYALGELSPGAQFPSGKEV